MNKQRKTSHILNVFQYDDATGIIGLNGAPVSGYGLYLTTNINDGSVGIDSSASINALYLLKNTTKQFEISYDTSGAAKIFRLLPYQSGSFFQIGNPSNAANSNSDYVFISEATYGNVLIGPGIGNGTGNLTGATASIHKVQFNGAVFANNSIQATSFKITGGASTGFLKADGTVDTVTYLSGNQSITVSGDATGSGTTSIALTLANTAVTPGVYGSTTLVPVVTVDSKGRITSVTTAAISGSLTFTGDVTGSGTTGTSTAMTLAASGVTAGTYTKVTVDSKGRVTVGASATTSDISEGTNLYYTDARVLSYLSANTYATQSYVNTQVSNLVAAAPATLDTLNELAAALGNDPSFATTISTALGNRLRVDINNQGLSGTLQGYGRTNLGLGTAATSNTGDFVAYRTFGTAANSATGDFVAYRTFGTAANNNTGDFATAAQGTKADTAFGWGNHASAGYAASSHTHSIADVTGLQTALDGKQASGSYAASSHSHIISDVTGLQTALDGKQASLGYTPYNSTNPSGYITSSGSISGSAGSVAWTNVTGRPTTLSSFTNDLGNYGGWITSSGNISGYAMSLNGYAGQTEYTILTGPANGPVIKVRYDGATANRYIDIGSKDGNGVYSEGLKIYNGSTLTFTGYTIYHTGNIPTWNQNTTGTAGSISGFNNPTTASTANTIAYRDASGDIAAREFVLTAATVHTVTPSSIVGIYPTTNQVVKFSASAVQTFLGLGSNAYSSTTIPTNNNQLTNGAGYITSAGNAATATTATYASYLNALTNYSWSSSSLPQTYHQGITSAFVGPGAGEGSWQNYGSVMTMRTYGGGGGSLQLYTPYGPSNGGDSLQVRFGNYNVSTGNSWTGWKTLIDSGNIGSQSVSYATTAGSISGFNNPTTSPTANTIMYRDGSGYVQAVYYYSSNAGRETTGINSLTGKISAGAGYMYEFTAAAVQTFLGLGSLAYSSATIPTNNNQLTNGAGYITASALTPYLLKSGGTMTGTLTFASISGAAQTVPNTFGAYLHLGDWAVARTAAGAVLVNTAYRADYATDLFDMNISRFTNNSGYITSDTTKLPLAGGTMTGTITITSTDIRSNASSGWTGDPGAQGKIQYHSNRWYIVADQSSDRIVQFRRNGTDVSHIDNSGNYIGNASTATTATTANNLAANTSPTIQVLNFTGVGGNSGNANQGYAIYQEGGAWSPPFPDLCIGYHTGIKLGAHYSYNGIRFYNNSDFATQTFSVNDGDNHVRVAYNLYVTGTVTGSNLSGTNTGDQTNISGNAATATYATSAGSAPNASNVNDFYNVTPGLGYGLKFWNSDNYKISMGASGLYYYGPVTDYSIKMQMNDGDTGRGFTWGRLSYAPIAALNSTSGNMQIAGTFTSSTQYVANGNSSATMYGPNATWGASLWVGAASTNNAGQTAQVISTDGNLHLDAGTASKQIYINYYSGMITGIYGGLNMQNTAISNASYVSTNTYVRAGTNVYTDQNYGYGLIGLYSSYRFQGVFAMGDAYKLPVDGTTTGNLYGLAWSHPNAGGQAANLSNHGLLVISNGVTQCALSNYIWALGNITANGNMYSNVYYMAGSTSKYIQNNTTSYTSLYVGGSQNGYSGIRVDGGMNLMMHTNGVGGPVGFWHESVGWSILTYANGDQNLYCNGSLKLNTATYGILVTGEVRATGDITAYYSDIRLKKDIDVIPDAIEKIKKLRGVTYTWNEEEVNVVKKRSGQRDIGLIAQEVEAVEPLFTKEYQTPLDDGPKNPDDAVNYNPRMSETYKTIKYDKLVALLVEGMKEQQLQIEELKNKLDNVLSSR